MINISAPAKVSLSGNAIKVKLTTTSHLENAGQKADAELIFSAALVNNEQISFEWDNNTINFTCKTTPDDGGLQFADNAGALPLEQWIEKPYLAFISNYHLTQVYKITKQPDRIVFVAHEKRTEHTLTITAPGDKTTVFSTPGITPVLKPYYALHTQVVLGSKDSPDETKMPDAITPSLAGEAGFDIAGLFRADFEPAFQHPHNSDVFIHRPKMALRYDIGYFESSGVQFNPGKIFYAEEYYALQGGISDKRMQQLAAAGSSWWYDLQTNKRFLTTQPGNKTVSPNQPERLYWFNYTTGTSFCRVAVKVYYTDGTTHSFYRGNNALAQYNVYEIPCGYGALGLGDLPKTVDHYEVWIEKTAEPGVAVSEVRNYIVDLRSWQNLRYVVFRNSLGGYDTIRCTGSFVRDVEAKRDILTRVVNDGTRSGYEYFVRRPHKIDMFRGNIGWSSKDYYRYLEDFFMSEDCYLLDGDRYDRLVLTTDKEQFDWDDSAPGALQFDALWAVPDFFFSDEITAPEPLPELAAILHEEEGYLVDEDNNPILYE